MISHDPFLMQAAFGTRLTSMAQHFDVSGGILGRIDDTIHGLGIAKSLGRAALAVGGVMVSTTLAGSSGASILETDAAPLLASPAFVPATSIFKAGPAPDAMAFGIAGIASTIVNTVSNAPVATGVNLLCAAALAVWQHQKAKAPKDLFVSKLNATEQNSVCQN